jgi:hypothetical protein
MGAPDYLRVHISVYYETADAFADIIARHSPHWVKIEEGKPETLPESEAPIWTYDGRCVRSGYMTDSASFGDEDHPEFHNGIDVIDGVIAWMPMEIPAPPTEGDTRK